MFKSTVYFLHCVSREHFATKLKYWIKCAIRLAMFHLTMSNLNVKLYQLQTFDIMRLVSNL